MKAILALLLTSTTSLIVQAAPQYEGLADKACAGIEFVKDPTFPPLCKAFVTIRSNEFTNKNREDILSGALTFTQKLENSGHAMVNREGNSAIRILMARAGYKEICDFPSLAWDIFGGNDFSLADYLIASSPCFVK